MAEPRPVDEPLDRLEAAIALAIQRAATRRARELADRHGKIAIVKPGHRAA